MNNKTIAIVVIVLLLLGGAFAYSKMGKDSEENSDAPKGKIAGSACTMDYNPVCGVNGITYGNSCMAQETEIAYVGECTGSSASGTYPTGESPENASDEELASS